MFTTICAELWTALQLHSFVGRSSDLNVLLLKLITTFSIKHIHQVGRLSVINLSGTHIETATCELHLWSSDYRPW